MPWLERVAQLQPNPVMLNRPVEWKTKLVLRREPYRVEFVTAAFEIGQHLKKILPEEMRQHEPVVQRRTPTYACAVPRLAPEPCDQRAHEQLLRERHARVRRHFEGAEFVQSKPPHRALGREQLVDADLGPVRVAGNIDQQIA